MPFEVTSEQAAILVAIITAVLGPVVGAWAGWRRAKKAAEATATKEVSQGWRERAEGEASVSAVILEWSRRLEAQAEALNERNRRYHGERNEARARVRQLESYVHTLLQQMEALGCQPVPPMPPIEDDY